MRVQQIRQLVQDQPLFQEPLQAVFLLLLLAVAAGKVLLCLLVYLEDLAVVRLLVQLATETSHQLPHLKETMVVLASFPALVAAAELVLLEVQVQVELVVPAALD